MAFRFLNEHLERGGTVPDDWIPRRLHPVLSLDPGLPPPDFDTPPAEAGPAEAAANADPEDQVEEEVQKKLGHLVNVFPETDPEFLHAKIQEFVEKKEDMTDWINETLENKASGLPSRKDYETRVKVRSKAPTCVTSFMLQLHLAPISSYNACGLFSIADL